MKASLVRMLADLMWRHPIAFHAVVAAVRWADHYENKRAFVRGVNLAPLVEASIVTLDSDGEGVVTDFAREAIGAFVHGEDFEIRVGEEKSQ